MHTHTYTHMLMWHSTPVQKGRLYCDSNTRCSFFCWCQCPFVLPPCGCDPPPPSFRPSFQWLEFLSMIWANNANRTPTKGKRQTDPNGFAMSWCIKVIFSYDSSTLTLLNTHRFLLWCLSRAKVLPLYKNFPSCLLCSKPLKKNATYPVPSPHPRLSLHTVCSFQSVSVVV